MNARLAIVALPALATSAVLAAALPAGAGVPTPPAAPGPVASVLGDVGIQIPVPSTAASSSASAKSSATPSTSAAGASATPSDSAPAPSGLGGVLSGVPLPAPLSSLVNSLPIVGSVSSPSPSAPPPSEASAGSAKIVTAVAPVDAAGHKISSTLPKVHHQASAHHVGVSKPLTVSAPAPTVALAVPHPASKVVGLLAVETQLNTPTATDPALFLTTGTATIGSVAPSGVTAPVVSVAHAAVAHPTATAAISTGVLGLAAGLVMLTASGNIVVVGRRRRVTA